MRPTDFLTRADKRQWLDTPMPLIDKLLLLAGGCAIGSAMLALYTLAGT